MSGPGPTDGGFKAYFVDPKDALAAPVYQEWMGSLVLIRPGPKQPLRDDRDRGLWRPGDRP